jgi:hypothetical protein
VKTEGKIAVRDDSATVQADETYTLKDLTEEILRQLKIMNLHLSLLTNEEISNVD